jgi:DNA polymerase-3 subunit epsilon
MDTFAAIDFETANYKQSSICAAGVVIVRDGEISESIYHLVRPRPNYYITWFTEEIHGISWSDTIDEPEFPAVWAEIAPRIAGLPLAAHNSRFDEGCLRAAFSVYGMEYPDYTFYCTCNASRRIFGRELPNHKLDTVARRCGYELKNHHHALADAEACAWIAVKIL